MKERNYKYGNNGDIPFRYIATRGRSAAENTFTEYDHETGEIKEIVTNANSLKNLNKGFKTLGVSAQTTKKISRACKILSLAAVPRTVRNSKGEYIPHLCTFITLTLPSEQKHTDQEITKIVLGTFLDKCRKLGLLQNYVWRAEKQKNKNIHYHILTDTFANFSLYRRIWILALQKLNLVDDYTKKFSSMTFAEYSRQSFNKNANPTKIAAAYGAGVRNGWSQPPVCHTAEIQNTEGVSKYISKYISKSSAAAENIVTGRVWSCSSSISCGVIALTKDQEFSKDWYHTGAEMMRRPLIISEYFSLCIFRISSLFAWFPECKKTVKNILKNFFIPCQYWRNSVGLFPV